MSTTALKTTPTVTVIKGFRRQVAVVPFNGFFYLKLWDAFSLDWNREIPGSPAYRDQDVALGMAELFADNDIAF